MNKGAQAKALHCFCISKIVQNKKHPWRRVFFVFKKEVVGGGCEVEKRAGSLLPALKKLNLLLYFIFSV